MLRGALAVPCMLMLASLASAGDIDYSDVGWVITTPPDFSVSIARDPSGQSSALVLEIAKTFRYAPDPLTGVFPSILLSFQQVKPDAQTVSRIIIADESITNLTGSTWEDFHWILLGFGYAEFNVQQTNPVVFTSNEAPGWQIVPFTQYQWGYQGPDAVELSINAGQVASGQTWQPGIGPGSLVIDLNLGIDNHLPAVDGRAVWVLKELPSVPEPATLAVLNLGGLALLRRRR